MNPKENKKYYAQDIQRKILIHLITLPDIENNFFLTGGTALAVFYLNHRQSNDLDFFTLNRIDLSKIGFEIQRIWTNKVAKIKESPNFLSLLIKDSKVDFVIDPLSNKEKRQKIIFENHHHLIIDNINKIVSNKLCTLVSRTEPKDYIDFYFIRKHFPSLNINSIYKNAKKKDVIFDDPPSAAYQIEEGLNFLKNNFSLFPKVIKKFNKKDFFSFYNKLADWLYKKVPF